MAETNGRVQHYTTWNNKKGNKKNSREIKNVKLTYLAIISIFVIDSCSKTVGVHESVFGANDRVDSSLEPAG